MSNAEIAGQMIEQYEFDQLIEQSNLSSTYLAYDSERNQQVLLRLLEGPFKTDEKLRANYLNRVRSLSRIRHPNIANILDYGVANGRQPYVVTEQVEGFPLAARLDRLAKQESPAHVIYALTLVRQIASGLALAERLDFSHFALTPQNILLKNVTQGSSDAAVLINLDCPLECRLESDNGNDPDLAQYLAPEQLTGKLVDGRSQVYSLGVILFQLLSGQPPSARHSNWRAKLQLAGRSATPLHQFRHDLTPETYALVERATSRRASRRFASVSDLLNALDQALNAEDLRIHTSNIAEPSRPWPLYLAPLLLLILCVLVAGAIWWTGTGSTPPDETIASDPLSGSPSLMAILLKPVSSPAPALAIGSTTASSTATATSLSEQQTAAGEGLALEATETPTAPSSPTATASIRAVQRFATPTATATTIPSPTATQLPTMQPTPTTQPQFRISVSSASLRDGPGTRYAVDSYLLEDDTVTVMGRTTVGDTWLVVQTNDGRTGWISASVGQPNENMSLDIIAPAATIPSPPPTYTPTPSPTPRPTATATEVGGDGGGGNGTGNGGSEQGDRPRATPTPPL